MLENTTNDRLFNGDDPFTRLNLRLRVGDHVVDRGSLRVVTHPARVRLTGKAMAVLIELARHAGDTVTREELMKRVWRDRKTTGNVLVQAIRRLRIAFADDSEGSHYIETVPRVGYRLVVGTSIVIL